MIFNSTGGGGVMMDVVVSPTLPAFAENRIAILTDEQVNAITMDAGRPENPQPGDIHILLADGPYTLTLGNGGRRITVRPKEALQHNGESWWPCDAYIGQGGQWLQFSYTPPPLFAFTGNYTEEQDDTYYYMNLLTSGTAMFPNSVVADVFLVGGGGGGAMGGGGSGYTKTFRNINILKKSTISAIIGAGGLGAYGATNNATDGGYTQFGSDEYRANGGKRGLGNLPGGGRIGGDGGSGGGGGSSTAAQAGKGGSDGNNGLDSGDGSAGGVGQHTTTRAFEDSNGALYAGGGGGFANNIVNAGGAGGGGNGGLAVGYINGSPGKINTGGGGGGGVASGQIIYGGNGGSGIVIVRWPK